MTEIENIKPGEKNDNEAIQRCRAVLQERNKTRVKRGTTKVIDFDAVYVSCVTCDVCYDQNNLPTFCQKGLAIDPRDVLRNMERASQCAEWFPRALGRRVAGPEYGIDDDRWYEKDSMG